MGTFQRVSRQQARSTLPAASSLTQPSHAIAPLPAPASEMERAGAWAQLEQAARFGHTFDRISILPHGAPPVPIQKDTLGASIQAARRGGHPLNASTQRTLEQGLGADLSAVRLHTDAEADRLTRSVNAAAFTSGADIFFCSGRYDPCSSQGLRLLAHEATHTIQQATEHVTGRSHSGGISISDPDDRFEKAAEANAAHITSTSLQEQTIDAPVLSPHLPPSRPFAIDSTLFFARRAAPLRDQEREMAGTSGWSDIMSRTGNHYGCPVLQRHLAPVSHVHVNPSDEGSNIIQYTSPLGDLITLQGQGLTVEQFALLTPQAEIPPPATLSILPEEIIPSTEGGSVAEPVTGEKRKSESVQGEQPEGTKSKLGKQLNEQALINKGFPPQWLQNKNITRLLPSYLLSFGESAEDELVIAAGTIKEQIDFYYYMAARIAERTVNATTDITDAITQKKCLIKEGILLVQSLAKAVKGNILELLAAVKLINLFIGGKDKEACNLVREHILPCYEYFGKQFTNVVDLRGNWPQQVGMKRQLLALIRDCQATDLPAVITIIQAGASDLSACRDRFGLLKQCPGATGDVILWVCTTHLAIGDTLQERAVAVNYIRNNPIGLPQIVARWVVRTFQQAQFGPCFQYIMQGVGSEDQAEERFFAIKQTGGNTNQADIALNAPPFTGLEAQHLIRTTLAAGRHIASSKGEAQQAAVNRGADNSVIWSGEAGMIAELTPLLNHYRGLIRNLPANGESELLVYHTRGGQSYYLSVGGRTLEERPWRELEIIVIYNGGNPNNINSYILKHCQPN